MLKLNTIDYFKNVSDRYYASKDGFIYYLNMNKEFKKNKDCNYKKWILYSKFIIK